MSGNLFVYYAEGNSKAVISPDVFVVFGVSHRKRRSYKTWQENNNLPSFSLEITSKRTQKQDQEKKLLPKALRFYDAQTNRVLPSQEDVLEERDDALQALDNAEQRAAALAETLRSLGIDPDEG